MDRCEALKILAITPTFYGFGCRRKEQSVMQDLGAERERADVKPMPVLFLAHGAPVLLDDAGWVGELASWAKKLPRPQAVLMISAHWEKRPASVGATKTVPLVYDFYGFPERYYQVTYPSPGAPALAKRVKELFAERSIASTDDCGVMLRP